jgi:hypothetical protein
MDTSQTTTGFRTSTCLFFLTWLLGVPSLLAGCGGASGGIDGGAGGVILLQNGNNYLATGRLSIPVIETQSGADLDVCWTHVTTDLQCHSVAPTVDIDNVAFLRIMLSQSDVEAQLTSGDLQQSSISGYVEFHTEHTSTCTKLSKFSFNGTPIDVPNELVESADSTYMILFAHGLQKGVGARDMVFVKPTTTSTNTMVNAQPGCGLLDFIADLHTHARVSVPATAPWNVDWQGVTLDGQLGSVIYAKLDKLLVGFYEGKTVADLEANFFNIETLATSLWDLPLNGGRTADLSQAKNRATAAPFDGFSHGAVTWILGLFCSKCQNPAPVVLVVLDPKGAP